MAIMSWLGIGLFKRVQVLEENKANRKSTDARFERVDARFESILSRLDDHIKDDKQMHIMIGGKLDTTNKYLADTNVKIAELAGAVKEQQRRDARH